VGVPVLLALKSLYFHSDYAAVYLRLVASFFNDRILFPKLENKSAQRKKKPKILMAQLIALQN